MDKKLVKNIKEKCQKILDLLNLKAEINVVDKEDDGLLEVNIDTEDGGILIGYRGQNLHSLQYILSLIVSEYLEEYRLLVDVNSYKEESTNQLKEKAIQIAEQVKEDGVTYDMGFLSPFDRRVVHIAVGEIEGVTTESLGEDRLKKMLIKKE